MKYLYHYYAIQQPYPGEVRHIDGVMVLELPISCIEHFAGFRKMVAEEAKVEVGAIVICSVSLLYPVPSMPSDEAQPPKP